MPLSTTMNSRVEKTLLKVISLEKIELEKLVLTLYTILIDKQRALMRHLPVSQPRRPYT